MLNPINFFRFLIKKLNPIWGLFIILLSFIVWLIPDKYHSLSVLGLFFLIFGTGSVILFDGLDYKLSGSSLLVNGKNLRFLKTFGLAAVLAGFILDFFVHLITKNYIYPYFTTPIYLILFIPGFIFYFLVIAESYFASKSILDRYLKRPLVKKFPVYKNNMFQIIFLLLGFISTLFSLLYYFSIYSELGEFNYSTNKFIELETNIFITMLLATSLWLIIETIGYFLGRKMLLTFIFRGYFRPLSAVLLACILLGVPMEVWNVPLQLWTYTNWPLDHFQILGTPILVFLSWPFHYLPFLSLYLLINKKVEEPPYEFDRIKTP